MDWHIDPDIRIAQTPPSVWYRSEEVFQSQKQTLFPKSWQLINAWPNAGEARPFDLASGLLDEPLIAVRHLEGHLRCFSNVCTHRGNLLLHDTCPHNKIRCGYHGRRFDEKGCMTSAPGFEGALNFPSDTDHLAKVPTANLAGMHFAQLQLGSKFDTWIAPVLRHCPWIKDWDLSATPNDIQDFEVAANWMVYCDNYLEGLHVPYVHPGLQQSLVAGTYETHLHPLGAAFTSDASEGEPTLPDGKAAWYFWLFPSTMINVYPWGVSMNMVLPQNVARTQVRFLSYVVDETQRETGAGGALDQVEIEDEQVVESVQKGLQSSLYRRGRYSPEHERAVHLFHRLLRQQS